MIHISNDPLSDRDHVVAVAVIKRGEEPEVRRLKPGESVSIEDRDGDLVSVFDLPVGR